MIEKQDDSIVYNIYTPFQCAGFCINNQNFTCNSFDFCSDDHSCRLSRAHIGDGKAVVKSSVTCDHFSRRSSGFHFLLAHLSRRLIGELIVYQWSGVRRPSVVRPSSVRRRRPQCSKIFFSETAGLIEAKFYVESPWVGGTIFCSRHLGHMTKMAATPIYGKNPSKIFFSRTGGPIFTKLGM